MKFQRKKQGKNNSKAYLQPHGNAKSQNTKSITVSGVIADAAVPPTYIFSCTFPEIRVCEKEL